MDATKIAAIIGLLIALSAASERMVEIVKGAWPWLNEKQTDVSDKGKKEEGRRKAVLHLLAVVAGILTTWLAYPAIPADLVPDSAGVLPILALGFLASGGSGLWNSVLTYVLQAKNLKEGLAAVAGAKSNAAATIEKQIAASPTDTNKVTELSTALARLDGNAVKVIA